MRCDRVGSVTVAGLDGALVMCTCGADADEYGADTAGKAGNGTASLLCNGLISPTGCDANVVGGGGGAAGVWTGVDGDARVDSGLSTIAGFGFGAFAAVEGSGATSSRMV